MLEVHEHEVIVHIRSFEGPRMESLEHPNLFAVCSTKTLSLAITVEPFKILGMLTPDQLISTFK